MKAFGVWRVLIIGFGQATVQIGHVLRHLYGLEQDCFTIIFEGFFVYFNQFELLHFRVNFGQAEDLVAGGPLLGVNSDHACDQPG